MNCFPLKILLCIVLSQVTASNCNLGRLKKFNKAVRKYENCLKQGFRSSIPRCTSKVTPYPIRPKQQRKCRRVELNLTKCGYICSPPPEVVLTITPEEARKVESQSARFQCEIITEDPVQVLWEKFTLGDEGFVALLEGVRQEISPAPGQGWRIVSDLTTGPLETQDGGQYRCYLREFPASATAGLMVTPRLQPPGPPGPPGPPRPEQF